MNLQENPPEGGAVPLSRSAHQPALAGWLLLGYFCTWLGWQTSFPLLPTSDLWTISPLSLPPFLLCRLTFYALSLPIWAGVLTLYLRPRRMQIVRMALITEAVGLALLCLSDLRLWEAPTMLLEAATVAYLWRPHALRAFVSVYLLLSATALVAPGWLSGEALHQQLGLDFGASALAWALLLGLAFTAVGWQIAGRVSQISWRALLVVLGFFWAAWGLSSGRGAHDNHILLSLGMAWLLGPTRESQVSPRFWAAATLVVGLILSLDGGRLLFPCAFWQTFQTFRGTCAITQGERRVEITWTRTPGSQWSVHGNNRFASVTYRNGRPVRHSSNFRGHFIFQGSNVCDPRMFELTTGPVLSTRLFAQRWQQHALAELSGATAEVSLEPSLP